jgi:hypothetical protein
MKTFKLFLFIALIIASAGMSQKLINAQARQNQIFWLASASACFFLAGALNPVGRKKKHKKNDQCYYSELKRNNLSKRLKL